MNWYLAALKKYARFDGRARRKEYWMYTLFNILFSIALLILAVAVIALTSHGSNPALGLLMLAPFYLYSFAMIVPGLAVTVRRLHDTGRSGAWFFIAFVPFVGGIILLVFACEDSQPGPNLYGPNPKDLEAYGQAYPAAPGY